MQELQQITRDPQWASMDTLGGRWKKMLQKRGPKPQRTAEFQSELLSKFQQIFEEVMKEMARIRISETVRSKGDINVKWANELRKDAVVVTLNILTHESQGVNAEDLIFLGQAALGVDVEYVYEIRDPSDFLKFIDRDPGIRQGMNRGLLKAWQSVSLDQEEIDSYMDQFSQTQKSILETPERVSQSPDAKGLSMVTPQKLLPEYATPASPVGDAPPQPVLIPQMISNILRSKAPPERTFKQVVDPEKGKLRREETGNRLRKKQREQRATDKRDKTLSLTSSEVPELSQEGDVPSMESDIFEIEETQPPVQPRSAQWPARYTPPGRGVLTRGRESQYDSQPYGYNFFTGSPQNADWSGVRPYYDKIWQAIFGGKEGLRAAQQRYIESQPNIWEYLRYHTRVMAVHEMFHYKREEFMQSHPKVFTDIEKELHQLRNNDRWVFNWDRLRQAGLMNYVEHAELQRSTPAPLIPRRPNNRLILDDFEFITTAILHQGWLRNSEHWEQKQGANTMMKFAQTPVQKQMVKMMVDWRNAWTQRQPSKDEILDLQVFLGDVEKEVAPQFTKSGKSLLNLDNPKKRQLLEDIIKGQWAIEFPNQRPDGWLPLVSVSQRACENPGTWFPFVEYRVPGDDEWLRDPGTTADSDSPNTLQEVLAYMDGPTEPSPSLLRTQNILDQTLREREEKLQQEAVALQAQRAQMDQEVETRVTARMEAREREYQQTMSQAQSQYQEIQKSATDMREAYEEAMRGAQKLAGERQALEEKLKHTEGVALQSIQQQAQRMEALQAENQIQIDEFRRAYQTLETHGQSMATRMQSMQEQEEYRRQNTASSAGAVPLVAAPGGGDEPPERRNTSSLPADAGAGWNPQTQQTQVSALRQPMEYNAQTGNVQMLPGIQVVADYGPTTQPRTIKGRNNREGPEIETTSNQRDKKLAQVRAQGGQGVQPTTAPNQPQANQPQQPQQPQQQQQQQPSQPTQYSQYRAPVSNVSGPSQSSQPTLRGTPGGDDMAIDNLLYLQSYQHTPGQHTVEVAEDVLYPGRARRDRIFAPMREALKAVRVTADSYRDYATQCIDRGFLPMRAHRLPPSLHFT